MPDILQQRLSYATPIQKKSTALQSTKKSRKPNRHAAFKLLGTLRATVLLTRNLTAISAFLFFWLRRGAAEFLILILTPRRNVILYLIPQGRCRSATQSVLRKRQLQGAASVPRRLETVLLTVVFTANRSRATNLIFRNPSVLPYCQPVFVLLSLLFFKAAYAILATAAEMTARASLRGSFLRVQRVRGGAPSAAL